MLRFILEIPSCARSAVEPVGQLGEVGRVRGRQPGPKDCQNYAVRPAGKAFELERADLQSMPKSVAERHLARYSKVLALAVRALLQTLETPVEQSPGAELRR